MIFKISVVLFAASLGMFWGVAEGSSLLTNGGFDGPVGNPDFMLKQRFIDVKPQGWSGGDKLVYLCMPGVPPTDTVYDNNGGLATWQTPGLSPNGGSFVIAHGDPRYRDAIYQTVNNLTVGNMYTVSFYQASGQNVNFYGDTWVQWIVGFGSQVQYSQVMITPSQGKQSWQEQSFYFKAQNTSETLSFLANGGDVVNGVLINGRDVAPIAYLDGASVNVPEPSSLTLAVFAIFGATMIRIRKQKKIFDQSKLG